MYLERLVGRLLVSYRDVRPAFSAMNIESHTRSYHRALLEFGGISHQRHQPVFIRARVGLGSASDELVTAAAIAA